MKITTVMIKCDQCEKEVEYTPHSFGNSAHESWLTVTRERTMSPMFCFGLTMKPKDMTVSHYCSERCMRKAFK